MYLAFYRLKNEPFRLTPDPRFFHLAEPHRKTLIVLLEGVLRRKGLMVVTGPIGTGKTTVLNAMMLLAQKITPPRPIVTAFLVNPLLSREEFLEALLQELEVTGQFNSRPQRLMALLQVFLDAQKKGGTTVIAIDEAHLLDAQLLEEIRLICNMDTHREQLVQVILCGQPELATILLHPKLKALRQRIALITQLRNLSLEETRRYVEDRLRCAGREGPVPFSASAIVEIYHSTHGVPRLINLVCDNAMVIGFNTRVQQIGPEIVRQAAVELTFSEPKPVATEFVGLVPEKQGGAAPSSKLPS